VSIAMAVVMVVIVAISVPITMRLIVAVSMAIVMVIVVFVLAVVIAVVVVILLVEFVAMKLLLPATMAIPVSMFAARGIGTVISEPRVVIRINVSVKAYRTTKPRPRAKKHASRKPLRAVIAKRSALVRRVIEIAIRTDRRHSNVDADLCSCLHISPSEADDCKNGDDEKPGQSHKVLRVTVWDSLPAG
jgi:hypothetical protein